MKIFEKKSKNTEEFEHLERAIVKYLVSKSRDPIQESDLLGNNQLVVQTASQIKIDWTEMANMAGVTRDRIYHWFHETYKRKSMGDKITKAERTQMLEAMKQAVISGRITEGGYQQSLKEEMFVLMGREIHRSDFSITFNNLMRSKTIKQLLEQYRIVIPSKRCAPVEHTTIPPEFFEKDPITENQNKYSLDLSKQQPPIFPVIHEMIAGGERASWNNEGFMALQNNYADGEQQPQHQIWDEIVIDIKAK